MDYARWLGYQEKVDGMPTFIPSTTDEGLKKHYVYCKHGPHGVGYYHLLTKVSHVNLYNRLATEGACGCGCFRRSTTEYMDALDTTRRVVYARARVSYPNDTVALEQQIQHIGAEMLYPLNGLKLK